MRLKRLISLSTKSSPANFKSISLVSQGHGFETCSHPDGTYPNMKQFEINFFHNRMRASQKIA